VLAILKGSTRSRAEDATAGMEADRLTDGERPDDKRHDGMTCEPTDASATGRLGGIHRWLAVGRVGSVHVTRDRRDIVAHVPQEGEERSKGGLVAVDVDHGAALIGVNDRGCRTEAVGKDLRNRLR